MNRALLCTVSLLLSTLLGMWAQDRCDITVWNANRGFSPFTTAQDTINNLTDKNLYRLTECNIGRSDFEWTTRFCAHNNARNKPYHYYDGTGHRHSLSHPAYGLVLISCSGDTLLVQCATTPEGYDDIVNDGGYITVTLILKKTDGNTQTINSATISRKQADVYCGTNNIKLLRSADTWLVCMGNHRLHKLIEAKLPRFEVSALGYMLTPGASLRLKDVIVKTDNNPARRVDIPPAANDTNDPLAGRWVMSEYNLDTQLLRPGGLYEILIIPSDIEGVAYDMVYLSGAKTNPDAWSPGIVKAELRRTSLNGVYDTIWYDAMHSPMQHNIRAQAETDGNPSRYDILTIRFPAQDSYITLRRADY